MGWAEGSIIAEEVWNIVKPYIGKDERTLAEVSKRIYEIFESRDADDWGYQLQYKNSLYYTYMKLNEPEEFKKLMREMYD
jgi:hypothetical protein